MTRIESNGSFLIQPSGLIEFVGNGGGENQVVTFNKEYSSFESTDLEDLFGGACVSQYASEPPSKRPSGDDLEIGDLWTNKDSKFLSIWDGEKWVLVKTINGNPVGTIIQNVQTSPSAPPPVGYLACDGTPCPPEYEDLASLLFDINGDTDLPNLALGFFIKY